MADTKSSAKVSPSSSATPPGAATGGPSLGQRALAFFRPAPAGAGTARRPQSSTSRFIMGSVIFIFVAEVITYGLDYANLQFKLNLQQPILGPSASWFTPFFVANVVVILGLWILLNRLGFFPRDMWNSRRNVNSTRGAASGGASNSASGSNGKNANAIPGIGKARTRAERRYTATVSAAQAASAKNGKQRAVAQTATRGASAEADLGAENDDAYDRARAAQRQRKRRALR